MKDFSTRVNWEIFGNPVNGGKTVPIVRGFSSESAVLFGPVSVSSNGDPPDGQSSFLHT